MDQPTQVTEEQLYSMSDEQFAELNESQVSPQEGLSLDEESTDYEQEEQHDDHGDEDAGESGQEDESTDADEHDVGESDDSEELEGSEEEDDQDPGTEEEEEGSEESESESDEVDYKAAYEQIFAPFKANGREMKVDNPEDAVRLMQMGANYTKKMSALKPNLRLLKMLENNKLLSEEKIGFYIDLENKNPEAIKKLLKDSSIDPMDLDLEEKSEYTPTKHTVDDRQVEIDLVLEEIQDTPTYSKTLDIVSNKWDGNSRQAIYANPQLLNIINDHVASGVYDLISSEIERERMFGRLNGLSDLDAYKHVGDALDAKGAFANLQGGAKEEAKQPVKRKVAKPKATVEDRKVKDKRRAASPTRSSAESNGQPDYNPLALSDDEFEKLIDSRYT